MSVIAGMLRAGAPAVRISNDENTASADACDWGEEMMGGTA
jgi:hypothetical protein